jgi:hypothetical protein
MYGDRLFHPQHIAHREDGQEDEDCRELLLNAASNGDAAGHKSNRVGAI